MADDYGVSLANGLQQRLRMSTSAMHVSTISPRRYSMSGECRSRGERESRLTPRTLSNRNGSDSAVGPMPARSHRKAMENSWTVGCNALMPHTPTQEPGSGDGAGVSPDAGTHLLCARIARHKT